MNFPSDRLASSFQFVLEGYQRLAVFVGNEKVANVFNRSSSSLTSLMSTVRLLATPGCMFPVYILRRKESSTNYLQHLR